MKKWCAFALVVLMAFVFLASSAEASAITVRINKATLVGTYVDNIIEHVFIEGNDVNGQIGINALVRKIPPPHGDVDIFVNVSPDYRSENIDREKVHFTSASMCIGQTNFSQEDYILTHFCNVSSPILDLNCSRVDAHHETWSDYLCNASIPDYHTDQRSYSIIINYEIEDAISHFDNGKFLEDYDEWRALLNKSDIRISDTDKRVFLEDDSDCTTYIIIIVIIIIIIIILLLSCGKKKGKKR